MPDALSSVLDIGYGNTSIQGVMKVASLFLFKKTRLGFEIEGTVNIYFIRSIFFIAEKLPVSILYR